MVEDTSTKWKDMNLESQVLLRLNKDNRPRRCFLKTATLNIHAMKNKKENTSSHVNPQVVATQSIRSDHKYNILVYSAVFAINPDKIPALVIKVNSYF
jgi:hypothetical protein